MANQTPARTVAERFGLGAVDQVSFVVRDIDRSLPAYEALFGPFNIVIANPKDVYYRGETVSPTLKLGFARSGDLEIELVEIMEGSFVHAEHLARHGEGLQHVRFTVPDLEAKRALMEGSGYTTVVLGRGPKSKFAYLEAPDELGHSMIELYERV